MPKPNKITDLFGNAIEEPKVVQKPIPAVPEPEVFSTEEKPLPFSYHKHKDVTTIWNER